MRASLGPVNYDQVLEARRVLEIALARMAAERATSEDVTEIEGCLQEMRGAIDDNRAFARADVRFHLAVARASNNEVLARGYYFIHSLLEKVVQEADSLPEGKARALVNHQMILDGIKTRNVALVEEASERQLAEVAEQVRTGVIRVAA
jgi:GntR family transcriptional repressor for pyruvate dehydrogenase complex